MSVLATSREALGVRGEHISPLTSLEVPDGADADAVLTSEAGALFVARAEEAVASWSLDDDERHAITTCAYASTASRSRSSSRPRRPR